MGTWGNGIKDNDTFADIYGDFFESYNDGKNPKDISATLISENKELINNPDNCNNFWFAIALAQWETKSLDSNTFEKVKFIIENEIDLKVWRELDADEDDIKQRIKVLIKFLDKIQTEPKKPKQRQKLKSVIGTPIFPKGTCICFPLDNGNYGGAIVIETIDDFKFGGQNYIAVTRINQVNKPTTYDFENAEVLITNFDRDNTPRAEMVWHNSEGYAKSLFSFEAIGQIKVSKKYSFGEIGSVSTLGWNYIKIDVDKQIEYEKSNPEPKQKMSVKEITIGKKWWQF